MHLEQLALIVDDYDAAIGFFVDALGFELVEDSPALTTNDGRPKRWVVVRPPGASTALLLARADGERQERAVGDQFAGRVGMFLRVDDFDEAYDRMREAGVEFVAEPRDEPYGQVAVFVDVSGNRWDLLGPRPAGSDRPAADTDAITQTILDYFEGWFDGDVARMDRALHPELAKRRAGDELGLLTKARMLELTGQGQGASDRGDGRVDVTVHEVYGDIATASVDSATYREYLHLVRTPGGWQIANALWRFT